MGGIPKARLPYDPFSGLAEPGLALQHVADGQTVTIPDGTWPIEPVVCSASNIVIEGNGTLTSENGDAADVLLFTGDNVTLRNFRVVGTGALTLTNRAGIKMTGDGFICENVEVTGVTGNGILFGDGTNTSTRARIVGCYLHGNGYAGFNANSNTFDVEVTGGAVEDNGGWNGADGYGVTVHSGKARIVGVSAGGNYTSQIDAHEVTGEIVVEGCTIVYKGTEAAVGSYGIQVAGTESASICNNTIDVNNHAATAAIKVGGTSSTEKIARAIIAENIIRDSPGVGIYVRPFDTEALAIRSNVLTNVTGVGAIQVEPGGNTATNKRFIARMVTVAGNDLRSSSVINVVNGAANLVMENNVWVNATVAFSGSTPFIVGTTKSGIGRVVRRNNTVLGTTSRGYSPTMFAAAPSNFSWRIGDEYIDSNPTAGGFRGRICTSPGTFGGTATTGDSTAGSQVLTNVASLGNVVPGDYLEMAGVTFGGVTWVEVLDLDLAAGTITVAAQASATTAGAAITWPTPTFRQYGAIS